MEQTKEISIAWNTREHHKLTMSTLFLGLFTPNPATLHTTMNRSIHPDQLLSPGQTPCTWYMNSHSTCHQCFKEQSRGHELKQNTLDLTSYKAKKLMVSSAEGQGCFVVIVLFFEITQIFQKKQGEVQTYRDRNKLPSPVPKHNYTSKGRTWKQAAHTVPPWPLTAPALLSEHPIMSPLPQLNHCPSR